MKLSNFFGNRRWILLILMSCFAVHLQGAVAIYMTVGEIQGGAFQIGQEGKIEATAWSWELENSKSVHGGVPAPDGEVTVGDLVVTKYLDKATPLLIQACAMGTVFDEAKLEIYNFNSVGAEVLALTVTMKNVLVRSINTQDNRIRNNDDRRAEELTLNFSEVTLDYEEVAPVVLDIVSITP